MGCFFTGDRVEGFHQLFLYKIGVLCQTFFGNDTIY